MLISFHPSLLTSRPLTESMELDSAALAQIIMWGLVTGYSLRELERAWNYGQPASPSLLRPTSPQYPTSRPRSRRPPPPPPLRGGVGEGEEIVHQEGDREGEGGVVVEGEGEGQEEEEGVGGLDANVKEVDAAI